MNYKKIIIQLFILMLIGSSYNCMSQHTDTIIPLHKVTLDEAHIGNKDIDTKLLDSYIQLPENIRGFYFASRNVFSENKDADFTDSEIIEAAKEHKIALLGGPMLGNVSDTGVVVWLRPATSLPLTVKVKKLDGSDKKSFVEESVKPGVEQRIVISGLTSNTDYLYEVYAKKKKVAEGSFTTSLALEQEGLCKVTFGSCFHKIGLHNPNLVNQILKREPHAMMLLGDIAVDDREDNINMHKSDYLLRDMSQAWQNLSANVPLYTSWDDHDYLNNDLSGIPDRFNKVNRKELLAVWQQNWNNPEYKEDGIYFSTRIGPVEIIMLDTRSCREEERRGQYASYLGVKQQEWLKQTLGNSTATFKIISSGTMWSDYVTKAKDSWGTWDNLAREEVFKLIETKHIPGVVLISGDRHGARGFTIPRPGGHSYHEFEAATLGGVEGPNAMADDTSNQLFGYHGAEIIAFGEFTFDVNQDDPLLTFRLINQFGKILEEHELTYDMLTPKKQ